MAQSREEAIERRRDLTISSPFLMLTGREVAQLQGPYVYELVAESGEVLYIGVKTGQSARPLDPEHHRIGRGFAMPPDANLFVYPMADRETARWVEAQWLREHAAYRLPTLNRNVPGQSVFPEPEEHEYLW